MRHFLVDPLDPSSLSDASDDIEAMDPNADVHLTFTTDDRSMVVTAVEAWRELGELTAELSALGA
jgi:hypothetical protein